MSDHLLDKKIDSNTCDVKSKENLKPIEQNGPKGLEPTRYGDWEKMGRCIDF